MKHGTKAYNFAVKHQVVMLSGYIHPSRLGKKVLATSDLHGLPKGSSCDDFVSTLPYSVQRELNNWRPGPPGATCRKPEVYGSQPQSVCSDDAAQDAVLKQAAEDLHKDIASMQAKIVKLQARKTLLDSISRPILERAEREARRKEEERQRKLEEERLEQERLASVKRKREEEERQEEARREEQRRKRQRREAEESRGTRISAQSCNVQDHVLENFDRQALHVALGNSSYIMLWDYAKGQSWKGIPQELFNKLNGRGYRQSHAVLAALCPDSHQTYYVQFKDGSSQWSGPGSFTEAVQDSGRRSFVAFGPRGSWFVAWEGGAWRHNGLPRSLQNMLNSNRHRSVAFLSISGIDHHMDDDFDRIDCDFDRDVDDAAWFVRWADEKHPAWKLSNAPQSLSDKIQEVQERGGKVRSVEFGRYENWVLRYSD